MRSVYQVNINEKFFGKLPSDAVKGSLQDYAKRGETFEAQWQANLLDFVDNYISSKEIDRNLLLLIGIDEESPNEFYMIHGYDDKELAQAFAQWLRESLNINIVLNSYFDILEDVLPDSLTDLLSASRHDQKNAMHIARLTQQIIEQTNFNQMVCSQCVFFLNPDGKLSLKKSNCLTRLSSDIQMASALENWHFLLCNAIDSRTILTESFPTKRLSYDIDNMMPKLTPAIIADWWTRMRGELDRTSQHALDYLNLYRVKR